MENKEEFLYDIGDIVEIKNRPGKLYEIIARRKTEEAVLDMMTNELTRGVIITYIVQKVGSSGLMDQGEFMQSALRLVKRGSIFFDDPRSIIDRALDKLNTLDWMYKNFGDEEYRILKDELIFALKTEDEDIIRDYLEGIEFRNVDDKYDN